MRSKKINLQLIISSFVFVIVFFACKKEDPVKTSINSIVGKRWFRVTDKIIYSFELESSGKWITYYGCKSKVEGTWTIDVNSSKLFHIYNGVEEEYIIINPTANRVKFKGGENSNSQIAPTSVSLVYDSKINYSEYDYIPKYSNFKITYSHKEIELSSNLELYSNDMRIDQISPIYLFGEENSNEVIEICCNNDFYHEYYKIQYDQIPLEKLPKLPKLSYMYKYKDHYIDTTFFGNFYNDYNLSLIKINNNSYLVCYLERRDKYYRPTFDPSYPMYEVNVGGTEKIYYKILDN
jgi:hypothetical protein